LLLSCYSLAHPYEWLKINWVPGKTGGVITFFVVNLIFVVVLGRLLCGFICPFGLFQDILDKIRQWLCLDSLRINEKQYQWLNLVKWELLVIFLTLNFIGVR
jgi:ferredoxin-type protein NapH